MGSAVFDAAERHLPLRHTNVLSSVGTLREHCALMAHVHCDKSLLGCTASPHSTEPAESNMGQADCA